MPLMAPSEEKATTLLIKMSPKASRSFRGLNSCYVAEHPSGRGPGLQADPRSRCRRTPPNNVHGFHYPRVWFPEAMVGKGMGCDGGDLWG
ncbi:unnamed protein product [Boreogadus saida]